MRANSHKDQVSHSSSQPILEKERSNKVHRKTWPPHRMSGVCQRCGDAVHTILLTGSWRLQLALSIFYLADTGKTGEWAQQCHYLLSGVFFIPSGSSTGPASGLPTQLTHNTQHTPLPPTPLLLSTQGPLFSRLLPKDAFTSLACGAKQSPLWQPFKPANLKHRRHPYAP